ncbi:heparinase II/III family protein [Paenibacillus sp.]|uniref:heparinase II/III domain-containing protein n=1 Tax=Paenibacillus sp. TaxID=58172 RepID=UPI002811BAA2|nr:heparinase II/III family protein [Paenibacillus sp.]
MDYVAIKRALQIGDRSDRRTMLFDEARDAGKWEEIRTSPFYREMVEEIREEGERLLSEPIVTLAFSSFKSFDTQGSRIEFERLFFARRKRLSVLAFLALLDKDSDLYVHALEDAIWAICDEYTWCLPAHLGGNSLNPSHLRRNRYSIDLFAAETGFALAEIVFLLKERISPAVASRAEAEVRERILETYCTLGSTYEWETLGNNWASVCGGSVGAAALYLIPSAEELAPIVHRLLGTMESYLHGFGNDGASTEGVGYWSYGFGFYSYFASLLKQRTAGRIDLLEGEKIKQIALFHQKCYLSGPYTVPFSDCEPTSLFSMGLIHALKRRYPEIHVPNVENKWSIVKDPIGRWGPFIRDFLWSRAEWTGEEWPDGAYLLPDAQWAVVRRTFDGVRYAFAAKGGHNDEPHNQNDIGSFVLHVDGETLLTDLGSGEYTKGYFGAERYSYLCNSSAGHSVPIVEGADQQAGATYRAKVLRFEESEEQVTYTLDMTEAYGTANLRSLVRQFTFARHVLELKDRYSFLTPPSSAISRFITLHEPKVSADGRVRVEGAASGVEAVFDRRAVRPVIHTFEFVNKDSKRIPVYAIDLEAEHPAEEVPITVRFETYRLT